MALEGSGLHREGECRGPDGGLEEIGGQQMSIWILLGIAAWRWLPRASPLRMLLLPVGLASVGRLVLFPGAEDRYFAWTYLITGVCFLQAMRCWIAQHGRDDAMDFVDFASSA